MKERPPKPTPTAFAFDLMLDGNVVESSKGYDYPTKAKAREAGARALFAYFDRAGPPEVPNLYVYVTSKERWPDPVDGDPVVEEGMYDLGVPYVVRDNGGKTADRFSVYFTDQSVLFLSEDPGHPQGVSTWDEYRENALDDDAHKSSGPIIPWASLPERVRKHVRARMDEDVLSCLAYTATVPPPSARMSADEAADAADAKAEDRAWKGA